MVVKYPAPPTKLPPPTIVPPVLVEGIGAGVITGSFFPLQAEMSSKPARATLVKVIFLVHTRFIRILRIHKA
jgi:hypothetical protein